MRLERIEDMSRHQGSCVHGDKLKKWARFACFWIVIWATAWPS